MGVKGLLPCLRSITRPVIFERYRGLTVAVDAMAWLHKGVYAGDVRSLARYQWGRRATRTRVRTPSLEPARTSSPLSSSTKEKEDDGENEDDDDRAARRIDFDAYIVDPDRRRSVGRVGSARSDSENSFGDSDADDAIIAAAASAASDKCVAYAMRNAETLRHKYGMELVLVVDGGPLPSKGAIDRSRRDERHESYRAAMAAESRGDARNARKLYARACSVTLEMRHALVKACRTAKIHFVVAPYEADGQLAQLAHSGAVDLVMTEDSDLLAYGCPRVLFKADVGEGKGEEVQLIRDLASNDDPSFRNWTHDMFVYMCIVSGCDYCEGVPGVGIKTAHKLVRMYRTPKKIFSALRAAGRMPSSFEESFWSAYRTFRHQRVYNQEKEQVEPLLPIDEARLNCTDNVMTIWPYLGPWIDPVTAKGIATGLLHPVKKKTWEAVAAANRPMMKTSIDNDMGEASDSLQPKKGNRQRENGNRCPRKTSSEARENMFKFFPSKKNDNLDEPTSFSNRPPLKEIFLDCNKPCGANLDRYGAKVSECGVSQPIPIHFNEYSSKLVGRSFEPLSRRSRGTGVGRDFSRAVQRVRENAMAGIKMKQEANVTDSQTGNCIADDKVDKQQAAGDEPAEPHLNVESSTVRTGNSEFSNVTQAPGGVANSRKQTQSQGLKLDSISSFGIPAHKMKSPLSESYDRGFSFDEILYDRKSEQKEMYARSSLSGHTSDMLKEQPLDIGQNVTEAASESKMGHLILPSYDREEGSNGCRMHPYEVSRPHSSTHNPNFDCSKRMKRMRPWSSPASVPKSETRDGFWNAGNVVSTALRVDDLLSDQSDFLGESNCTVGGLGSNEDQYNGNYVFRVEESKATDLCAIEDEAANLGGRFQSGHGEQTFMGGDTFPGLNSSFCKMQAAHKPFYQEDLLSRSDFVKGFGQFGEHNEQLYTVPCMSEVENGPGMLDFAFQSSYSERHGLNEDVLSGPSFFVRDQETAQKSSSQNFAFSLTEGMDYIKAGGGNTLPYQPNSPCYPNSIDHHFRFDDIPSFSCAGNQERETNVSVFCSDV